MRASQAHFHEFDYHCLFSLCDTSKLTKFVLFSKRPHKGIGGYGLSLMKAIYKLPLFRNFFFFFFLWLSFGIMQIIDSLSFLS